MPAQDKKNSTTTNNGNKNGEQLDPLLMPLIKENMCSGNVLIAVNDVIAAQKSYGMANIRENIPNGPETKFRVASVSKTFTAVAIMQLCEQGKLDLEDKLAKFLPDFPNAGRINIFHLLSHSSGLPDYLYRDDKFAKLEKIIEQIKNLKPRFEPGAEFDYSNSGYALLTYLIESISGLRYEQYLEKNIFRKAGMENSGIVGTSGKYGDLALGYSIAEYRGQQESEPTGPLAKGDGAVFCTAEDLFRYNKAFFNNTLISAASRKLMLTPIKESYGLGWFSETRNAWNVYHHPGGSCGTMANFKTFLDAENKITVINLFNNDLLFSPLVDRQIENIALGEPWQHIFYQDAFRLDLFRRYAGTYQISPEDIFTLSFENGKLFYQAAGQKKCGAFAYDEASIYVKEINSRFKFTMDPDGGRIEFSGFIGTPEMIYRVEGERIDSGQ